MHSAQKPVQMVLPALKHNQSFLQFERFGSSIRPIKSEASKMTPVVPVTNAFCTRASYNEKHRWSIVLQNITEPFCALDKFWAGHPGFISSSSHSAMDPGPGGSRLGYLPLMALMAIPNLLLALSVNFSAAAINSSVFTGTVIPFSSNQSLRYIMIPTWP